MSYPMFDAKIITNKSTDAACQFSGCDYTLMNDCATGVVEVVLVDKRDKNYVHGFNLELKFNASFNSNIKNSQAILISNLKTLNAVMWYENSGITDKVDYEIGSADSDIINAAIKQHIVDRIKAENVKTILRDDVLAINFNEQIAPEYRMYGDGLRYVDVRNTSEVNIELEYGSASGSLPIIIEGSRVVYVDFKVDFDEKRKNGIYLGGKLVLPKIHELSKMYIEKLSCRDWRGDDGYPNQFHLTPNEIALIKHVIVDNVKYQYNADAYPQGKDYYLSQYSLNN